MSLMGHKPLWTDTIQLAALPSTGDRVPLTKSEPFRLSMTNIITGMEGHIEYNDLRP